MPRRASCPLPVIGESTPELSVRTSASGHGRPPGRPWDTSPQAIDAPHLASPRSSSSSKQLLKKTKILHFLADFWRLRRPGPARNGGLRGGVKHEQRQPDLLTVELPAALEVDDLHDDGVVALAGTAEGRSGGVSGGVVGGAGADA